MKLGKHQLCLLATMASPFSLLIVADKVSRSLVKHGVLAPHLLKKTKKPKDEDAFFGITPVGLRAVAFALETGQLNQFVDQKYRRDMARLYVGIKASEQKAKDDG